MVVIDGQQRLTTIIIMLCAICVLFNEAGEQDRFNGVTKYILGPNVRAITSKIIILIIKVVIVPNIPNSPVPGTELLFIPFWVGFLDIVGISLGAFSCDEPLLDNAIGAPQYLQNLPIGFSSFPHFGQNTLSIPFVLLYGTALIQILLYQRNLSKSMLKDIIIDTITI